MRFVLVGLPGVGKSTLAQLLAEAAGGHVAMEDPSTFGYLEDALADPARYAALSQVEFMLDKARVELAPPAGTLWQEDDTRYLHHVWTRALARDGRIDSRAESLLDGLASVLDTTCPQPAGIIALELGLEALERRVIARGRAYETSDGKLDDGFRRLLAALHCEHRRYMSSTPAGGPPLWSVDASQSPEAVVSKVLVHTRRFTNAQPV